MLPWPGRGAACPKPQRLCRWRLLRVEDNPRSGHRLIYGPDTVPAGATMVESHRIFAAQGRKQVEEAVPPTDHLLVKLILGRQFWQGSGSFPGHTPSQVATGPSRHITFTGAVDNPPAGH
jgi:hypothetical protein